MKMLTANHIKEADRYTIDNEPVSSIDLMERACEVISKWMIENISSKHPLLFFIGKGNNGGDGLAVARMMHNAGYDCSVCLVFGYEDLSEDSKYNYQRLPESVRKYDLSNVAADKDSIIIDALLGTGVKGDVVGLMKSAIARINEMPNEVISIDMPSGMRSEFGNDKQTIVKADTTLTLQFPKLAMLLPEAGEYCGNIIVLPIGLSMDYINRTESSYYYITEELISSLIVRRSKFAHKNTYGHALLICGSKGMSGAAVLATGAALRSGCGLVTLHLPESERFAVQVSYPSAMLSLDRADCFSTVPDHLDKYTAVGIGCGLGQSELTIKAFEQLLKKADNPMVIDADALNILAGNTHLQVYIPSKSILTPHIGELRRLIGEWQSEGEKIELVKRYAFERDIIIVVKGAHTMVCLPSGDCYFNSTGNSGMAKGGSGDVLTGYITGLLSRGYNSVQAALIGVYIHGLAGDITAQRWGVESMNSSDIIDNLATAMSRF